MRRAAPLVWIAYLIVPVAGWGLFAGRPLGALGTLAIAALGAVQERSRVSLAARRVFGRVRLDYARAAAVAAVALEEYPESPALRQIASSGGLRPDVRPDLNTLARTVRTNVWPAPDGLRYLLTRDGAELPRMLLQPELRTDAAAATALLQHAGAVSRDLDLNRQATLIGFTARAETPGGSELNVFFQLRVAWKINRLWLHACPPGSGEYVDVPTDPPAFRGWTPGEFAWEVFHSTVRSFNVSAGAAIGGDLGSATGLAQVADCAVRR